MSDNDTSSSPQYSWLLLFFKGIAMGAADVVPGVSGGTIAFITGIYARLLNALTMLHPLTLRIIVKQGFAEFWQAIDGRFLLTLFSGIIVSILSLAKLINYALDNYPIAVWSFFFGLVVASVIYLIRQTPQWRWQEFIAIALGAGIAVSISVLRPAQLPDTWWMMMLSGFIAICAMILPGISGSFILLLMGMYSVFIQALTELNLVLLASFSVGCVLGLIVFSHILSFLLRHYLSAMLALLTGFLLGSLSVLWPWKQVLETSLDRHGDTIALVQTNVSPMVYATLTNNSAHVPTAILTACVGVLIVFLLDRLSIKQ
jgi:putative membrane protein